jgi:tripartite ATP-independent transporter DctM subunit
MVTMSVEVLAVIIFGSFFLLLGLGFPAAFTMLAVGVISSLIYQGPSAVFMVAANTFTESRNLIYLAIPMFVFMAQVFEHSNIGEDMFNSMYRWFGGLRGGLGVAVIVIGALLSCVTGLVATATVLMGLVAYPQMIKKGYNKRLSIGAVLAAGILGPIIPPSLPMIVIGMMASVSIGKLFIAGILPGFIAAALFCLYTVGACYIHPSWGPSLPKEERGTFKENVIASRGLILPIILSIIVLGGLFAGAFTPTEAAAVGAFGALICMLVRGKFNFKNLKASLFTSISPSVMVMWIIMGGTVFSATIISSGITEYIGQMITSWDLSPNMLLIVILAIVLIEGLALEPIPIAFSNLPIFMPLIIAAGIDPLWFVFLFTLDCIVGMMTPPFGSSMFFFLGLKFEGVTTADVFVASVPWVIMLIMVLALNFLVPSTVLFLPNLMIR